MLEEKPWFSGLILELSEVVLSNNIILSQRKQIMAFLNIPKLNDLEKLF